MRQWGDKLNENAKTHYHVNFLFVSRKPIFRFEWLFTGLALELLLQC